MFRLSFANFKSRALSRDTSGDRTMLKYALEHMRLTETVTAASCIEKCFPKRIYDTHLNCWPCLEE